MRSRSWSLVLAAGLALLGSLLAAPAATAAHPDPKPQRMDQISLPDGWRPEGISARGDTFFVGSIGTGAIWRGNLRTGEGAILVPAVAGRVTIGTEVDDRGRLWVAGGPTGTGRVYDTKSGAELASFQFTTGTTFVNDVVVTDKAAYFTDSLNPVLYVVPLGRHGKEIGKAATLPLTGDLVQTPGVNNLNGIETTPDGRSLIVVQSNTGLLLKVDPKTGVTKIVDIGGATLLNGDGLLLLHRTLYVVQNRLNQIQPVTLSKDGGSGTLTTLITNPLFDVPATIAYWKGALYAANARFTTMPTPETAYTVVRTELP